MTQTTDEEILAIKAIEDMHGCKIPLAICSMHNPELVVKTLASRIRSQAEADGEKRERELVDWATGEDTGTSSEFLCRYMIGIPASETWGQSSPMDAADRGRCIRLLNRFPEWWDRLDELAKIPSRKVNVFSSKGFEVREEGWKEQIPLIRKEAATLRASMEERKI